MKMFNKQQSEEIRRWFHKHASYLTDEREASEDCQKLAIQEDDFIKMIDEFTETILDEVGSLDTPKSLKIELNL